MNYKKVIDRVFTNLHIDDEDSKDLKIVRHDIEDTLVDVFGRSEYPKKEVIFTINETEDITEDFSDSTLIDDLTLTNINVTLGKGEMTASTSGILEVYPKKIFNTCSFTLSGIYGSTPVTGTVKVIDENNNEVYSESFSTTSLPYTNTFTIGANGSNLKLQVTINVPADITTLSIDDFSYNTDDFSQKMPDDFFIPMEVKFDAGKRRYVSKEMTPEQYILWTPFKFTVDSDTVTDITAVDDELSTYQFTDENLDYDYKLGYYFQTTPDGIYLHWKPKFAGTITIYYSYLPTLTIADASTTQVHRTYVNMLVNGVTQRWLRREFNKKDPQRNEIEFAGLRTAYSEYKAEFDRDLAVFAGWVDQRATPALIQPFDMFNDPFMELD